ncbi:DNA-3-methyladenine glycosylase [uncultured Slackia sp.]|uniref:DNA-3-methyladenine glycosylase family protein n=1 Tax=uncultured Slackia sp. TaxID=665903 RepID=UPI0025F6B757|nr:hypothetical protein [uncultured Slackia sp.]
MIRRPNGRITSTASTATIIDIDSPPVAHLRERDWRLARLIERIGSIECHASESGFANLAHSIIEQMLSTKVAATMDARLRDLCGGRIAPETLGALTVEEIRGIGVSKRKAECLANLARTVTERDLEALAGEDDETVHAWLTALPGIGEWTAHMFMLFHLNRPDVLPVSDLTFRKSFEWLYGAPVTDAGVRTVVCDLWRPYCSYAARYLYRALDLGLVVRGSAREVFNSNG